MATEQDLQTVRGLAEDYELGEGDAVKAVRWSRTDTYDGTYEILTLVRRDAVEEDVVVEVKEWANDGLEFMGLYDLDEREIQLGDETWTVVGEDEVSPETIAEVEDNWECGSGVLTRFTS